MKVVGFSFVRNALKYDYPILESIQSVLAICDEFILLHGNSEDDTALLLQKIKDPKLKISNSTWDDSKRKGGAVLADECNKVLKLIPDNADWLIYIQADEVLPEFYHDEVLGSMQRWKNDPKVEGLLFGYKHFYGNYQYVADSPNWYRHEIRIIKNLPEIYSYRDAQGFRIGQNRKLKVKSVNAYIHHYGWVKHPAKMQSKQEDFNKLWHDDDWIQKNIAASELYDYSSIDSIQKFNGKHPKVMQKRIENADWQIDFSGFKKAMSWSQKIRYYVERWTGYRFGEYKNYKRI